VRISAALPGSGRPPEAGADIGRDERKLGDWEIQDSGTFLSSEVLLGGGVAEEKGVFGRTLFVLTGGFRPDWMRTMSASKLRWCWRKDLAAFRGLTDFERSGFLLVLEWFENFRLRHEMEAGRDAAKAFWRSEVQREDRKREVMRVS
jgi:hypothetical protein